MTYKEVILAIRGYEIRNSRDWERFRLIAYQVYAGTPKKGSNKSIYAYLPLPTDRKVPILTKEEDKALREFFIKKQLNKN